MEWSRSTQTACPSAEPSRWCPARHLLHTNHSASCAGPKWERVRSNIPKICTGWPSAALYPPFHSTDPSNYTVLLANAEMPMTSKGDSQNQTGTEPDQLLACWPLSSLHWDYGEVPSRKSMTAVWVVFKAVFSFRLDEGFWKGGLSDYFFASR